MPSTCAMVVIDMNEARGVLDVRCCLSGLYRSSFLVHFIIMLLAPA